MPLRHCLSTVSLAVSLLASAPLPAQPPAAPETGPWAADADGDGRITRDEMRAYMERRFGLMDQDSDGLVPVQAMQRMLGHERQARAPAEDSTGKEGGPGKRHGGPGGGREGPGGAGGPPPGGRPPRGDRADAAPPPPGRAMPWPEDSNDDGQIDRAEFLAPALALFADQDRSGDGVLTADELPPPPGGEARRED
ncbi:hypothetical protein K9B33_02435 [Sphingobium sp. 3R8]|uniref:hypothetical protein n=1 Tax=Sphingobium sp. 3R8 TaxID=2874921 RepID=UPI001CD00078|nr:hypothetical protein [Sphingobium sp. 3R8]MBZ9646390.1 hypothetical protein [Sphingobium sp. 3R8]